MENKMNLLKISCLLTSLISLVSCGNKSDSGDKIPEVNSLKNGLLNLCMSDNYTLSYEGNRFVNHDIIYTKNSIGVVSPTKPTTDAIYVQDGTNGVYLISYNGEKIVASEYVVTEEATLWDGTLVSSFKDVEKDYIKSLDNSITELDIKNKKYRINFLEILGYSAADYLLLGTLVAKYVTYNDSPSILFEVTYKNTLFTYYANAFGTSKNMVVDKYIEDGNGVYKPDNVHKAFRTYLKDNNYMQAIYNYAENPEESGYVGYNVFNPNYFYTFYGSTLTSCSGYIAINGKSKGYYGCYLFTLTYEGGTPKYSQYPQPTYSEPNMPEYFHYPSYLTLLNRMEMMRPWNEDIISKTEYTPSNRAFVVTDSNLVYDFANNYSLLSSFEDSTPLAVGIDFQYDGNAKTDNIIFVYKFLYGGETYIYPIPMFNFGSANNAALEQVLKMYQD